MNNHNDRLRKGLSGLTYTELAERYEVELCTGWCHERGHEDGFVARRMVHWRERRVTRSGLRKFLILVADLRQQENARTAGEVIVGSRRRFRAAQLLARRNLFAYRTALHDLGIRLPRSMSTTDRAQVLHLLRDHTGGDPAVKALRNWAREA